MPPQSTPVVILALVEVVEVVEVSSSPPSSPQSILESKEATPDRDRGIPLKKPSPSGGWTFKERWGGFFEGKKGRDGSRRVRKKGRRRRGQKKEKKKKKEKKTLTTTLTLSPLIFALLTAIALTSSSSVPIRKVSCSGLVSGIVSLTVALLVTRLCKSASTDSAASS